MPVPPQCQPIADLIANLSGQEQDARDAIPNLGGADRWKKMLDLGKLRQQLTEQETLLSQCQKQNAADVQTAIVVFDLPGGTSQRRIARVWKVTQDGQAVKQTVTVQDNAVTLNEILGTDRQSFGITVEGTDDTTVNGPDFRSGPLPTAPAGDQPDPTARIELVILPSITILASSLSQAAPPLPIQLSFSFGAIGNISISVTSLDVVIDSGDVSFTASGTASSALPSPVSSPFTFKNSLHIAPAFSMTPSVIVDVLTGSAPTLTMPGLIGSIIQSLTPMLSSALVAQNVSPMLSLLNTLIATQVADSLGLSALPSGCVLSIRSLTFEKDTITCTPVLGAFGTVLSTFVPAAPSGSVSLQSLTVQPSLITTGDPAGAVATGNVALSGPAPAGGVTILLSCDRPNLVAVNPTSLFVTEKNSAGQFTVSAVSGQVMSSSTVDCTVQASLNDQTLTAPLAVRPEQPRTQSPQMAATSTPTPFVGDFDVASITLLTPSPIPLQKPVSGQISLNGLPTMSTVYGTIVLDPSVVPPIGFIIPVGSISGYFQFSLGANFPGHSLRITAWTGSGGVKKSIDVLVGA